jgi:antitoxin PrlF
MLVNHRGQVTIPKHIRAAASVVPGSEVSFSLKGSKIVITPVRGSVKNDRRSKLRAAAARVRASMSPEFKQIGADEIMAFLRAGDATAARGRRGKRWPFAFMLSSQPDIRRFSLRADVCAVAQSCAHSKPVHRPYFSPVSHSTVATVAPRATMPRSNSCSAAATLAAAE